MKPLIGIFVVLFVLKVTGIAPVAGLSWWLVTLPIWPVVSIFLNSFLTEEFRRGPD